MGNPQLSRADMMSQRGRGHAAARPRMSQAGKPAAPVHLESDQHANTRPAGALGRRSKGPGGKSGVAPRGVPLQGPRLGRTQPRSPAPHLRLQGMPCPSSKSPKQSLASRGQKDEVGEVRGFF